MTADANVNLRLPISGAEARVSEPSGSHELALLESGAAGVRLALEAAIRLAPLADPALQWSDLPAVDLEHAALRIRQAHSGDQVRSTVACAAAGCGAAVEIEFSIEQFLAHHRPASRDPAPVDEAGWRRLDDGAALFRIPTVSDQIAAADDPQPVRWLIARCLRPSPFDARTRRKAERAMEAIAPSLISALSGRCPECGAAVEVDFDPIDFVMLEIAGQAAFVYEDVHTIAFHYHWPEQEILALPRRRRIRYAEMARGHRSAA